MRSFERCEKFMKSLDDRFTQFGILEHLNNHSMLKLAINTSPSQGSGFLKVDRKPSF
jgi:hypothetical protein